MFLTKGWSGSSESFGESLLFLGVWVIFVHIISLISAWIESLYSFCFVFLFVFLGGGCCKLNNGKSMVHSEWNGIDSHGDSIVRRLDFWEGDNDQGPF